LIIFIFCPLPSWYIESHANPLFLTYVSCTTLGQPFVVHTL
jgi:hypothetical protein